MHFKKLAIALVCACLLAVSGLLVWASSNKIDVAFTFDDGTKDHYLIAAPILEKYGYRGLFNIIVDDIGKPGYLTWDDVRDLQKRGHCIGTHSLTHANMRKLLVQGDREQALREINASSAIIETNIGHRVVYFCFPHNDYNGGCLRMVKECGLVPVPGERSNLGGAPANPTIKVDKILRQLAFSLESHHALMFHGLARNGIGYAPYDDDTGATFETVVKNIKENEGKYYRVVNYENVDWNVGDKYSFWYRVERKLKYIMSLIYGIFYRG